jgi:hypothetical protein
MALGTSDKPRSKKTIIGNLTHWQYKHFTLVAKTKIIA